jgi:hypothetical protein
MLVSRRLFGQCEISPLSWNVPSEGEQDILNVFSEMRMAMLATLDGETEPSKG